MLQEGARHPEALCSLAKAFLASDPASGEALPTFAPQLDAQTELPPGCTLDVINTALRVASKVATEGVGESQPAKVGTRERERLQCTLVT